MKRKLSVADKHQLRIAKQSMTFSCMGCVVAGGANHKQAAIIIERLTGKLPKDVKDCICMENHLGL